MTLNLEELKSKYPNIFSEYDSENEIDWKKISHDKKLSEDFIREFKDKVNWTEISYIQKLSEDFIREFQNKVKWFEISYNQKLSEYFIREFKDKLDWRRISYNQKLSDEFCKEFNIESNILNSVFYSGKYNRCIYIKKDNPNIIYIGCFSGTKPEAIKAINEKYSGQEAIDYISKVEECFNF